MRYFSLFTFYSPLNYTLSAVEVCGLDRRAKKNVCSLSALRSVSQPEIDKTLG